jgi:hypothetical protein
MVAEKKKDVGAPASIAEIVTEKELAPKPFVADLADVYVEGLGAETAVMGSWDTGTYYN